MIFIFIFYIYDFILKKQNYFIFIFLSFVYYIFIFNLMYFYFDFIDFQFYCLFYFQIYFLFIGIYWNSMNFSLKLSICPKKHLLSKLPKTKKGKKGKQKIHNIKITTKWELLN